LAKLLENSKTVWLLGELSMSIYLVHTAVIRAFRHVCDISDWSYMKLIPLFVILLVTALLHYFGTKWLVKGITRLWARIRCRLLVLDYKN